MSDPANSEHYERAVPPFVQSGSYGGPGYLVGFGNVAFYDVSFVREKEGRLVIRPLEQADSPYVASDCDNPCTCNSYAPTSCSPPKSVTLICRRCGEELHWDDYSEDWRSAGEVRCGWWARRHIAAVRQI